MQRWRNIALAAGWIGLVWIVMRRTSEAPISDSFWIDLVYAVGVIALAVLFVVGLLTLVNRRLNLSTVPLVGVFLLLLTIFAVIENAWLLKLATQFVQGLG